MRKQNTLKKIVSFRGVGIHSGKSSQIRIKPAPENTGILFVQKDQPIPFHVDYVKDTRNNISIGSGDALVKTVEHLVSSLYALHIDNCVIECSSPEIPIMDGSAHDFTLELLKAGTISLEKEREELKIEKPIWVTDGDKFIIALPYEGFKIHYTISFPHSAIGVQNFQTEFNKEIFISEISKARTFGFIEDLDSHLKSGLSKGVDFNNVHVFSKKENRSLNTPRYPNEPVRHKILDMISALALLNCDIKGFIIAYKAGHALDVLFAKKAASQIAKGKKTPLTFPNPYYYAFHSLGMEELPS